MVHSLSEIWTAAATPPLWLSSQLTVGKEHPLVRPAQPKTKEPPTAAHSKWHRQISKMTHYRIVLDISHRTGQITTSYNSSPLAFSAIRTQQRFGVPPPCAHCCSLCQDRPCPCSLPSFATKSAPSFKHFSPSRLSIPPLTLVLRSQQPNHCFAWRD